jgi:hypothetical protein
MVRRKVVLAIAMEAILEPVQAEPEWCLDRRGLPYLDRTELLARRP